MISTLAMKNSLSLLQITHRFPSFNYWINNPSPWLPSWYLYHRARNDERLGWSYTVDNNHYYIHNSVKWQPTSTQTQSNVVSMETGQRAIWTVHRSLKWRTDGNHARVRELGCISFFAITLTNVVRSPPTMACVISDSNETILTSLVSLRFLFLVL